MENNKTANEVQGQEKVAAEGGKMASIPGTPEWIKSRKGSK